MQEVLSGRGSAGSLQAVLKQHGLQKVLIVCDGSYPFLSVKPIVDGWDLPHVFFSEFTPNPLYEDVCKGVAAFRDNGCDGIVAIGGGSTIDVAKCIKLFCGLSDAALYLDQPYRDSGIPLFALPTTAGTGSESTHFAVIYYQNQKQSVAHESLLPNGVVLDSSVLSSLPVYQKKCTLLDALCQGIESWWSVNSTDESLAFSRLAVREIMTHYADYLAGDIAAEDAILTAANTAGRAINITQTTAAHAMSYQLTKRYQLPHGHSVAIGLPYLWRYMLAHLDQCVDPRGAAYLEQVFSDIAHAMGQPDVDAAIARFEALLRELDLQHPGPQAEGDLAMLVGSVNQQRLKNNPVALSEDAIRALYQKILS